MEQKTRKIKRVSEYGRQFTEKQELKKIYGIRENQLRRYIETAQKMPGSASVNLLVLLERRLDNVIFRLGFATSRAHARQLAAHGHFKINGKRADIPSILLNVNDVVEIKKPELFDIEKAETAVSWLLLDKKKFAGEVRRFPSRDEIDIPIDENLVIQFYSR